MAKKRKIPSNRTFVNEFLSKFDIDLNNLLSVFEVSKGLSLNDAFWIVDPSFNGIFSDFNLYEHRFSEVVGQLAFTGFGSYKAPGFYSSPEFTTGGMLAKCWRMIDDNIYLCKAGTSGYANAGKEPYSEYYAAQLAKFLGFSHVQYGIIKWKGKICSICPLFTDINTSFIPMSELIPRNGQFKDVIDYLKSLDPKFMDAFSDMIVFDALIENTDRHLNNFGVLFDNKTDTPVKLAPLFDHGNSLLYHALDTELDQMIEPKIPNIPHPVLYRSYTEGVSMFAQQRHSKLLRHMINFEFKPHAKYNVSAKRLKALNIFVRNRAMVLLSEINKNQTNENDFYKSNMWVGNEL